MRSWNYSKLKRYETCPYQLVLADQYPQTPNEHMTRGIAVHKQCEDFLNGEGPLPNFPFFTEGLTYLTQQNTKAEVQWGLANDWTPTDWTSAWGRCVIDAFYETPTALVLIDFKTGKPSPVSHQDQAQTYAIAGHSYFPQYPEIHTQFWYLDSGKCAQTTFTPPLIYRYRTVLNTRIQRMINDTHMNPKPNKYVCQWCNYKDHCEYNAHEKPPC
jgi:hypothetical protein